MPPESASTLARPLPRPARPAPAPAAPPRAIGATMADGTIYAGVSPDTGREFFATAEDAPSPRTFSEATQYATTLDAHGHRDWRIPSPAELHALYQNRRSIGNFNHAGRFPTDWYWSSYATYMWQSFVWSQRFSDGMRDCNFREYSSRLRCVRG